MDMARLNGKRRRQLAATRARHELAVELNPTTQAQTGDARSIWNDNAKVHRAKEQRFRPDRPRLLIEKFGRVQGNRVVPKARSKRWD